MSRFAGAPFTEAYLNQERRKFLLEHTYELKRRWSGKETKEIDNNITLANKIVWASSNYAARARRVAGMLRHNAALKQAKVAKLQARGIVLCACGCGTEVKNKWVSGHNAKGNKRKHTAYGLFRIKEAARKRGLKQAAQNRITGIWPAGEANRGIKKSVEDNALNSIRVKKAIAEGRFNPKANILKAWANVKEGSKMLLSKSKYHKHGWYFSEKMQKDMHYDSSWELERMKTFDADPNVIAYKRIPLRVPYVAEDGVTRTYLPDFAVKHVDGSIIIEEIKPLKLVKTVENQLKFAALKQLCIAKNYVFRLVTSLELCKVSTSI